jgi:putative ABC transport system permease protein
MSRHSIISLAARNIQRKPSRTVLLTAIIAAAAASLFGLIIIFYGMSSAVERGMRRLGADIIVVPEQNEFEATNSILSGKPSQFFMGRKILDDVKVVAGVKAATPQIFIKPAAFQCCYDKDTFLVAFDPATDFTVMPWVKGALKKPLGDHELISGSELPLFEGTSIPFYGTRFDVVATLERTGFNFFDQSVFITLDAAYAMAEQSAASAEKRLEISRESISAVLVRTDDSAFPEKVAVTIDHQIAGVKAIPAHELMTAAKKQIRGINSITMLITVMLWALTFTITGMAYSMTVNERKKEIGIMRAMGARKQTVFRLVIYETIPISLIGSLTGILSVSAIISMSAGMIERALGLPYIFPSFGISAIFAASLIILSLLSGIASAILPAIQAAGVEPLEDIARG